MKIISLNTWGGGAGHELLLDFFRQNKDTDIFCLQEVWNGGEELNLEEMGFGTRREYRLLDRIAEILNEHDFHFRPHVGDYYGLVMFVRKGLPVTEEGEVFVYQEKGFYENGNVGNHARNLQYVTLGTDVSLAVINFHGLWNGKGKTDTPDRIAQSNKIVRFIKNLDIPYVLVGDFNLRPDTESVRLLEETGAKNLIKEYNITSTRTSFYGKNEQFADYAFVSPEINVKEFKVMSDEVSDHAPLLVEIE